MHSCLVPSVEVKLGEETAYVSSDICSRIMCAFHRCILFPVYPFMIRLLNLTKYPIKGGRWNCTITESLVLSYHMFLRQGMAFAVTWFHSYGSSTHNQKAKRANSTAVGYMIGLQKVSDSNPYSSYKISDDVWCERSQWGLRGTAASLSKQHWAIRPSDLTS